MALLSQEQCNIVSLNEKGIGVGKTKQYDVYLPYTLPGEIVKFQRHRYRGATSFVTKNIIVPSENRVVPPCRYFTFCGGCMLQHAEDSYYRKLKSDLLNYHLDKLQITTKINPIIFINARKRRRAVFEALKKQDNIYLGFKKYNSHQIINIDHCLLLLPQLDKIIFLLKELLKGIMQDKQKAGIHVLYASNGIDVVIESPGIFYVNSDIIAKFGVFAEQNSVIKVSLSDSDNLMIIYHLDEPYVEFDNIRVKVSAKSFLQASFDADRILQKLVLDFLLQGTDLAKDSRPNYKVVDLFCGRGTITIPVSKYFPVDGFELDSSALTDLNMAMESQNRVVNLLARDLYLSPLTSKELKKYDFAIINPPRQGALQQVQELAGSNMKKICYISCNPATFARDTKIMISRGYKLIEITPVDQFYWSPHIELVAYFV